MKERRIIGEKYLILKEIGHGGMSTVYLAKDIHLQKLWAVKEICKQTCTQRERILVHSLLEEANLMKKLDHPALPRIVDMIDAGIRLYVVMDYVAGESLEHILKKYGARPEKAVVEWAKQLCGALIYLHSQDPPIIYRDMKPANIILKPDGHIKLIDFGIAREYIGDGLSSDTTILGTRGYAPPEQYSGRTDARSDIYALGMTLHHLLTGVDPRTNPSYAPIRDRNPELSESIEHIIEKCVQPAAEKRYQNCKDLLYDLDHPDEVTPENRLKYRRKRNFIGCFAALAACILLTAYLFHAAVSNIHNKDYEILTSPVTATSITEKISCYKQAIALYPQRTEAYLAMLEAYEDEGHFTQKENDEFLAVYNRNKSEFDPSAVGTAELNYKAGIMYFNYYTNEDGTYSFSARVQKAYSFFSDNHENGNLSAMSGKEKISDCYYFICYFYKCYILNSSSVDEASKEDYENLIEIINQALDEAADAGAYDRLSLYHSVFMLLYDQRKAFATVQIEREDVMQLAGLIYENTKDISVNKKQSLELKKEVVDNYKDYVSAIERAYINVSRETDFAE